MQLTVVLTSPRLPRGLLDRGGWRAVESADRVLALDAGTADALRTQGVEVSVADGLADGLPPGDGTVVLVADTVAAAALREQLPASTTWLAAPEEPTGARLLDLVGVMDRLRTECPWDREQTHLSLVRYLLEESYETIEALESGDRDHLREELGDLLLQVFFHARIAAEDPDGFDIDAVAGGIAEKLVYRHPHVFAGLEVADADEVDRNWETLKAAEKKRSSPVEGIPPGLPALAWADKVVSRLAKAGVDVPPYLSGEGVGAKLLALVLEARAAGLDPEQELRGETRRLISGTSG